MSCQDHIICNRQAQKLSTFAGFVDMNKVFDWVDRELLFLKVLMNNIDGKVYNVIKAMYSNATAIMSIKMPETDLFIFWDFTQGNALSTILFSIYINDLAK